MIWDACQLQPNKISPIIWLDQKKKKTSTPTFPKALKKVQTMHYNHEHQKRLCHILFLLKTSKKFKTYNDWLPRLVDQITMSVGQKRRLNYLWFISRCENRVDIRCTILVNVERRWRGSDFVRVDDRSRHRTFTSVCYVFSHRGSNSEICWVWPFRVPMRIIHHHSLIW